MTDTINDTDKAARIAKIRQELAHLGRESLEDTGDTQSAIVIKRLLARLKVAETEVEEDRQRGIRRDDRARQIADLKARADAVFARIAARRRGRG